ncbi:MAG: tripartite tricarboxylate transporter permease [Deltaproteobacteria bacterium]|nr:tripartite tricarboxylate transporter permease [Deltaproteobacteria bacterium]
MLLAGVFLGMLIGALPGLTATMGVAIFTPLTFFAPPEQGLCLLLGIYTAAMFGGAISAILINTPGTPAAIATTLDGYPMAKKGEAGLALGLSALGSAGGGLFSVLVLALIAFPMARFALQFGPAEFFSLAVFGLSMMIAVSGGSIMKGLLLGLLGLFLATIGIDPIHGFNRFTFGIKELVGGVSFIPILVGLFGMSEVLNRILEGSLQDKVLRSKLGRVFPTKAEIKRVTPAFWLSSVIGVIVGVIPAAGGDIASLISWEQAKRFSKKKEEFGKGSMEGLVAAETANNAVIGGEMATMLTLGIPGDAVTAILIGSLMMWGLKPGPLLFQDHIDLVYQIIAILTVATLFSLVISLYRIQTLGKWILKLPDYILNPLVLLLCLVGSYAINNSLFDVWIMFGFGVLGFVFRKLKFPLGPIVLGLILGSMAEANLRRFLILADGNWFQFVFHPIALTLFVLSSLALLSSFKKAPSL